ncbi:sensor histidine kinase [Microlunatus flavus]|uniref:histidine kinase n=1 Tax=Microlunatus flavus TaxID=1036181 RepID=A0A1H9N901_9ACTN|nr:histidine kinase [Microlunatus flavus]SER32149.1 Histidine kinase [Microlunatus flavus]
MAPSRRRVVPSRPVLRREALGAAWLLVGAAIGLAALLLVTGLVQVVAPGRGSASVALTLALVLLVALLGLLPGVRELEVTAARTLLGVRSELVLPEEPAATHRRRTVATVATHLVLGLLAGVLLVGVLPALVASVVVQLRGGPVQLAGRTFAPWSGPAALATGLAGVLLVGLAVTGLRRLAVRAVARLLGPTAQDRLVVALARLEAEAAHTRLARELHDGIGHALTIIGLQAAAGRRVLASDPRRTEESLGTIEDTARGALGELDDLLGSLRSGAVVRETAPGLDRLDALLATYRSGGMTLDCRVDELPWVPRLTSTTAYLVVAEGLTNAARHAAPGAVQLRVATTARALRVQVSSPRTPAGTVPATARGLGLTGVAERVRLLGGSVQAGPVGGRWVLDVELPRNGTRG